MSSPPLLEALAHDPVLGKAKLIAEAWDAGGLYQVGSFPAWGRWAEWNGKYRDCVRRFVKSGCECGPELLWRIQGSPDMYSNRSAEASINFITCHDGFTLNDMVSYNDKHNEANGEDNRDGTNDNNSWNCGVNTFWEERSLELPALPDGMKWYRTAYTADKKYKADVKKSYGIDRQMNVRFVYYENSDERSGCKNDSDHRIRQNRCKYIQRTSGCGKQSFCVEILNCNV